MIQTLNKVAARSVVLMCLNSFHLGSNRTWCRRYAEWGQTKHIDAVHTV